MESSKVKIYKRKMTGLIFDFSDETFPHFVWERNLIHVNEFIPRSPNSLVIHPNSKYPYPKVTFELSLTLAIITKYRLSRLVAHFVIMLPVTQESAIKI